MNQTMNTKDADYQKYIILRERWDKEDTLLLSRTGIFLTTNSILCAASRFEVQSSAFQVGVAVVGLMLSMLWFTTSWHSTNIIKRLYQMCKDDMPYDLNAIYHLKPVLFRPNAVFGKIVPCLIIISWLVYIIWVLT